MDAHEYLGWTVRLRRALTGEEDERFGRGRRMIIWAARRGRLDLMDPKVPALGIKGVAIEDVELIGGVGLSWGPTTAWICSSLAD
jgi:hypothetical protein